MKTRLIVIALFVALAAFAGYAAGRHFAASPAPRPVQAEAESAIDHEAHAEDDILYWTCGMHPQIMADEPGECPICGMKLTPVRRGGAAAEDGAIVINPNVIQNMGLRTALARRGDISRTIRAAAHVDYNEDNVAVVSTKIGGWLEKVHTREIGALVRRGQPLYEIYSPELAAAQQEYLLSLKSGSPRITDAAARRLAFWDVPVSETQRLAKTREVRKTVTMFAPRDGHITAVNAVEGMFFEPGSELFTIADISDVWLLAHLYEKEAPLVKQGDRANVSFSHIPGETFPGVIDYVYPFVDPKTRDIKARISMPNPGFAIKPQMYATVNIVTEPVKDVVIIPLEAVIRSGKRDIVFVDRGNGAFMPREIVMGAEDGAGRVQIMSGLEEMESVVVSGQFLLDSESNLREAIAKYGASAGGHDHGSVGGDTKKKPAKSDQTDHSGHAAPKSAPAKPETKPAAKQPKKSAAPATHDAHNNHAEPVPASAPKKERAAPADIKAPVPQDHSGHPNSDAHTGHTQHDEHSGHSSEPKEERRDVTEDHSGHGGHSDYAAPEPEPEPAPSHDHGSHAH